MRSIIPATRFIISIHAGTEGVRLSKPDHFTNLPFGFDAEAVAHARAIAGKADVAIERERYRAVRQLKLDNEEQKG